MRFTVLNNILQKGNKFFWRNYKIPSKVFFFFFFASPRFQTENGGSAPARQSMEHSSFDTLSQSLICKQKFLTPSSPSLSTPHPPSSLFFFCQGEAGPRGRKGEVCRIRLCCIRYNPFFLILRRSEKASQACMAAIDDLQSQSLMPGEICSLG